MDDFAHARLDGEDGEFLDGADLLPLDGHRQRQICLHHACLQPVRGRSGLCRCDPSKIPPGANSITDIAIWDFQNMHTFWAEAILQLETSERRRCAFVNTTVAMPSAQLPNMLSKQVGAVGCTYMQCVTCLGHPN